MEQGERAASYRAAGVDIEAAENALTGISDMARRTHGAQVLRGIGHFGGFFRLGADTPNVLVSTSDSVGTKVLLASILGQHRGIGIDLVNHCVNDLLATGARPLFFLDYYATPELDAGALLSIVDGLTSACVAAGCSLVGGETAELPGIYREHAYDLAGFMVGAVAEDRIVDGSRIQPGDVVVGLPSDGLHTNGFTLARAALGLNGPRDEVRGRLAVVPPWSDRSLDELLLTPHHSYLADVAPLLNENIVHGMAHITGGGLAGNLGRVIPEGLQAVIDTAKWPVPPLFHAIRQAGNIDAAEMYRVFNMGVGFVLVVAPAVKEQVLSTIPGARAIGVVEQAQGPVRARLVSPD